MEFKLQFDNSVAEIVADGVETEGSPPGFLVLANANNPGVLVFALAGSEPAGIGRFRLAKVTFHLIGEPGQSTSLSFTAVQAGDNSVPVKDIPVILAAGSLSIETAGAAEQDSGAGDPASGGPSATGTATTGVPQATTPPTSAPGPAGSPSPVAPGGQPTTESASPPQNAVGGCNPGSSPGDTWDGGWLLLGLLSLGLALRWVPNRGISPWSNQRDVFAPPPA
jgi:hypothetical protein